MPHGGVLVTDCFIPGGPPPWSTEARTPSLASVPTPGLGPQTESDKQETSFPATKAMRTSSYGLLARAATPDSHIMCPSFTNHLSTQPPQIPPILTSLPHPRQGHRQTASLCPQPVPLPCFTFLQSSYHPLLTGVHLLLGPLLEDELELVSVLFTALSYKNVHLTHICTVRSSHCFKHLTGTDSSDPQQSNPSLPLYRSGHQGSEKVTSPTAPEWPPGFRAHVPNPRAPLSLTRRCYINIC